MAELRRVGGEMVPHRGPFGSSALLPYEVDLINQVGLSVDEYREFQRLAAAYKAERAPGYEHIPDVRNEPTTTLAIISLVVGVASTAAALLMKPKPPKAQERKDPQNFEGGDQVGKSNFTPRYGFDSVQTLATLGQAIPLIFCKRAQTGLHLHVTPVINDRIRCGGVRVDTQLVWSALYSQSRTQELRIAALLGHSRLGSDPEYEGYAIGTTKLESIPQERVFLSFNKDGRRPERSKPICRVYQEGQLEIPGDQPDDLLAVQVYNPSQDRSGWNLSTSGTFTPSSNRAFGLYSQMPNATAWMLAYPSTIVWNDNSQDDKIGGLLTDEGQDARRLKLIKGLTAIPNGCGLYVANDDDAYDKGQGRVRVEKGDIVRYKISGRQYGKDDFNKEGADDINNAIQRRREAIDSKLEIGQIYQIGNFKARLYEISPNEPLQPGVPMEKKYKFEALEEGQYQVHRGYDSDWYRDSVDNGNNSVTPWYVHLEDWNTDEPRDDYDNPAWGNNPTDECCLISSVEHAVVSNTRKCNVTEIGIKSTVWRKVNLPNVNSFPEDDVIDALADSGGQIDIGIMDKYLPRYSFFRIFVRRAGFGNDRSENGNPWNFLHGGIKFAVLGKTPEPQYNWIRIFHPAGEQDAYEYKIDPVPGWAIRGGLQSPTSNERIWLLNGKRRHTFGSDADGVDLWNGFSIVFGGEQLMMTPQSFQISEFDRGPLSMREDSGLVVELNKYDNGKPRPDGWVLEEERYTNNSPRDKVVEKLPYKVGNYNRTGYWWYFFWDDRELRAREVGRDYSTCPFTVAKDGKLYVCGRRNTSDFAPPGIFRYNIQKWGRVSKPAPNVEVLKEPLNDDGKRYKGYKGLKGNGLKLTIYSYQDPFDPDDDTGNAAWWVITDPGQGYENDETAVFMIRGEEEVVKIYTNNVSGKANLYNMPALADYPQYDGESLSCEDGPEHEVAYVNQQNLTYGAPATYDDMAYCTLRLQAGRQMSQFSQLSAYVKQGLKVKRLIPDGLAAEFYPEPRDREEQYSTNLFPEIAYALLTDPELGVGELVGIWQVNQNDMTAAARFCLVNGFLWNGVLAERVNVREWIYEQASHNLLDFTVKGGRFSLRPALPYSAEYRLDNDAPPDIKGLFTDGNTTELQVAFLPPEERQLFQANVKWRMEEGNGFPCVKTTSVRLDPIQRNTEWPGGNDKNDPIEVFDLSNSVTTESHAVYFAKYALRARQCIDHTVSFKTSVNELIGIEPGDYIKVTSACSHRARWNNGAIGPDGQITSTEQLGPSPRILYWKGYDPEEDRAYGLEEIDLVYASDSGRMRTSQTQLWGSVFTQIKDVNADLRVYRVTSISYADDGMIEVSAAHSPLTESGSLMLADWNEDDFIIETAP